MKKLLLFMLATLVAMAAGAVEVFENGSIEYEIASSTRVTVRGLTASAASSTTITIPSVVTYNGTKYRVYTIRENAFLGKNNLTSVTIHWGVSEIKSGAFQNCTGLANIQLPGSLTAINSNAFAGCSALKEVKFTGFAPTSAASNAFPQNSGMKLIVPSLHITSSSAFKANAPWSYFSTVEKGKVYDCYTGAHNCVVGYPDTYDASVRRNVYLVNVDNNTTAITPSGDFTSRDLNYRLFGIVPDAFNGNTTIVSVDLSSCTNLGTIGARAFKNCTSMTSATILAKNIEASAFAGCTKLSSITLKEGIQTIANYAFNDATITSITVPASVTNLYSCYFVDNCKSLTSINVASGNANYASSSGVLYNKAYTKLYRIPEGMSGSYTALASTTSVEAYAAYHCTKLTALWLDYGVTSVGSYACGGCTSLQQAKIPSSVTSLASTVFDGCTSLSLLYVNMMTAPTINTSTMFSGVTLSNVYLFVPYALTSNYSSAGWTGFKAINSSYVQGYDLVDSNAFHYTVTSTSSYTANGTTYDGTAKLVRKYPGGTSETSITLPDYIYHNSKKYAVTEIADYGLYDYSRITSIKFGQNLKTVRQYGLSKMGLTGTLAFPYGISLLGYGVLDGTSITRLILPSSFHGYSTAYGFLHGLSSLTELVLNSTYGPVLNETGWEVSSLPSSLRILVPMNYVQQYRNHTNWGKANPYFTITGGAYDYIYSGSNAGEVSNSDYNDAIFHMTITSTNKVTYNGTTYDGTAKYVYHPNIVSKNPTSFLTDEGEADKTATTKKTYLITEIGDSCLAGSKVTSITIRPKVTKIGQRAFYNSALSGNLTVPTTVTSIGLYAFSHCKDLTSLRFGDVVRPYSEQIYGGNASNFECIVPIGRLHQHYDLIKNWSKMGSTTTKTPVQQLAAYFNPGSATSRSLGVVIPVSFTKSGIDEAYIASAYNKNQSEITLQAVTQIPERTGVILAGLQNREYILHQPDATVSAPSTNYFVAAPETSENIQNVSVGYYWDPNSKSFKRPTGAYYSGIGYAYLKLTSTQAGNNTVVYTDIFGRPGTPGDVNGDGAVTGDDLNMLINILLNKITANDPSVKGNPNVNGEGGVDGNDLNALINILLGK